MADLDSVGAPLDSDDAIRKCDVTALAPHEPLPFDMHTTLDAHRDTLIVRATVVAVWLSGCRATVG